MSNHLYKLLKTADLVFKIFGLYNGHSVLLFNKSGRKWELKLWIKKRPGSAGLIVIMEKIVIHFGEDCIPFFCFDQPFGMNGILTHIAVYDIK